MQSETLNVHKNITKFLLVFGTLLALLLLSSCADANSSSSSNQAITQSSPTASSPTQQPRPTATIASNTGPAVLGAQLSAFTTKFGQPNDHSSSSQPHLARCGNSNVDKLILSQVSLGSAAGPITSILYASCTSWTISLAESSCSTFFPADAVYQKSVKIVDSSGNLSSFDKIYYSATLAHEAPCLCRTEKMMKMR